MQEYKLSIFSNSDYADYLRIVNANTSVSLATQERRKWWCFDNPDGGAFAVALTGDGVVVATCYLSGKSLRLNGSSYKAYEIGETSTSPEHQRKGLFSKLVKLCVSFAFDQGASAVYGTPNSESTPGYAKLKFDIIADDRAHLFVSPNISAFLITGSTSAAPAGFGKARRRGTSYRISSAEFFIRAKGRARMNEFSEDYFKWRFTGLSRDRYAYFDHDGFSMATREHQVGRRKVLLIADFGYADRKPATFEAITNIRKIVNSEFGARQYAGIYFLSDWRESSGRLSYGLRKLVHTRSLPICVMDNACPQFGIDLRKTGLAQLSDCDMG